jgi:hypothetical protein
MAAACVEFFREGNADRLTEIVERRNISVDCGWVEGQAVVCSRARMGLIGVEYFAKKLGGPRPGLAPTKLRQ